MISVEGKVYSDYVKFPCGHICKSEEEKQQLIEEYRYLTDEATGRLLELINDEIESVQDKAEYKLTKKQNEHIQKMIDYIEWQFDLWNSHLKVEETEASKVG